MKQGEEVLTSASAGQDLEKDSPGAGRNSTMSGTPGSSQAKNSPDKVVTASRQDESASKKLTEKEDVVSKCPLKCAVPCCTRSGERLYQTTFFPCPLEPHPSSRLWAKAIGVKVILKNMYICEDHFQLEDDLENYLKFKYYPRGQQRFPRFKKGVVPWKFSKCRGRSPTVHHHRVPFSKTEFYKRQRSRISKAREILSAKENKLSTKGSVSVPKYGYPSLLWEPSNFENVNGKTEHVQTSKSKCNLENEQNLEKKRNKRSSVKKRKSEGRENTSCSEKKGYFNMLNGDLSTLIAHVQPAICSWDVSEVSMDPPEAESTNGLDGSSSYVENSKRLGSDPTGKSIGPDSKDTQTTGMISNHTISSDTYTKSKSALNISESSLKPAQTFESALSEKSDEESEDEIYMTPSEDEMNGYHDTSDTDFTVSSEESWGDYEIVKPARRSARNRCQKSQRTDRYSPPIVLRSRAKKNTAEVSPVVNASEPNHSSPKSSENVPQLDKVPETLNSTSGVSSLSCGDAPSRENGISKVAAAPSQGKDESETVETSERVEAVENRSKDAFADKSPGKENKLNVSPEKMKTSHVDSFLKNNIENAAVIRAVSSGTSDSESIIGDIHEDSQKTDETSVPKSPEKTRPNVAEASTGIQNVGDNPKWRLRTSKPPIKGARLSVDMSETVAKVFCPESQTSYSYKKVNVEKKPGSLGMNNRRRGKQDNFLLVRDGDQVLATSNSLPPQICGLISNMRSTFDAFFDNLDDLKTGVRRDRHSQNTVDACLTEPSVDRLLDEMKKYPDLLELEMAQFAIKCEKFYGDEMEKSLKNSKKIRWCNTCQSAARFHCCFSAAYCSRLCQSRDWGRHNRHCGQSRMLLDDPDLKLNPFMANRLKSVEYSKPTIGASMSNLEELHQSIRRPTNGQRILGSKNQSKSVKRGNASGLIDTSKPKVKRINYPVKSYPPASVVACASTNNPSRLINELQSEEVDNANVKVEPPDVDMEVERGSPPPRPKLVMGYSLVNNSSPPKTSAANQQVRITIPPNLLAGLPSNVRPVVNAVPVTNRIGQSNTTTVNSAPRITSVALVPRTTSGGSTLVIPKNTSPGATSTSPVTLRCRTVILPSGETQYIPLDGQTWSFKPNAQLVVKHVNQTTGTPVTVIKQAATSGSILITRPAKPAYSKFIPIAPSPTQSITSTIVSPEVATMEPPSQPPPLTARLPKLTPVTPKPEPAAVRTLDSSELDKILSTDHLKEAFDMSYASNILRP